MHKPTRERPDQTAIHDELGRARYALLRSYRRDGTPVDVPIWFRLDGKTLVFRTKVGPKTKRMATRPDVELRACDYKGRVRGDAAAIAGKAVILSGTEAEAANRALHERYGWQWNIIPMIKIPGVVNAHRDLPVREKLRRMRHRTLWPDSAIIRIDLD